jgi:hypothetical protein
MSEELKKALDNLLESLDEIVRTAYAQGRNDERAMMKEELCKILAELRASYASQTKPIVH